MTTQTTRVKTAMFGMHTEEALPGVSVTMTSSALRVCAVSCDVASSGAAFTKHPDLGFFALKSYHLINAFSPISSAFM